jgi:hypothetical protein
MGAFGMMPNWQVSLEPCPARLLCLHPQMLCQPGRYSTGAARECSPCPAGTYGSSAGLTSAQCDGPCSPGHACPSGSTAATTVQCGVGQYSSGGVGECSLCPPGSYGSVSGLTSQACSGACPAGRFGSQPGLVTAACSGACDVGFECPGEAWRRLRLCIGFPCVGAVPKP